MYSFETWVGAINLESISVEIDDFNFSRKQLLLSEISKVVNDMQIKKYSGFNQIYTGRSEKPDKVGASFISMQNIFTYNSIKNSRL